MRQVVSFDWFGKAKVAAACLIGGAAAAHEPSRQWPSRAWEEGLHTSYPALAKNYVLSFSEEFDRLDCAVGFKPPKRPTRWFSYGRFGDAVFKECDRDAGNIYRVTDGALRIRLQNVDGRWTSGALSTYNPGSGGFAQRYGVFAARIRLPKLATVKLAGWPSFWLLSRYISKTGAPYAEIDAFEQFGATPDKLSSTVFIWPEKNTKGDKSHLSKSVLTSRMNILDGKWHEYAVQWLPDTINVFIDRRQIGSYRGSIPDTPMYPMLSLALSPRPKHPANAVYDMQVDWVRVYRCKEPAARSCKESRMAKGAIYIVAGNLVSKCAGFVREIAFAAWFGTGQVAAGFRIAQTAYLLPAQALVGDSLGAGLLPLYKEALAQDRDKARLLVLIAIAYAATLSALISLFLFAFAPQVVHFLVPGASPRVAHVASELLIILSFATPAFLMGGMLSYLEASYGKFGAIAWRPLLLNIGSLGGAAAAYWTGAYHWLATFILLSHLVFVGWTILQIKRLDGFVPQKSFAKNEVFAVGARFLKNAFSLLVLPLVVQSTLVVERIVSSYLGTSVIASVDYARFLSDTTVQLIAMPLGIVTMANFGGQRSSSIDDHVVQTALIAMILATPVAAVMLSYPTLVVQVIFARGAFDASSVAVTAALVRWMGGGVFFAVAGYYLIKALNAQLRNKEALAVVLCGSLTSILINVLLWRSLGIATMGVAVAGYSFVTFVGSVLCLRVANRIAMPSLILLACLLISLLFVPLVATVPMPLARLVVAASLCVAISGGVVFLVPTLRSVFWTPVLAMASNRLKRRKQKA